MFKKSKLSYGLTAFLDVLGFGSQVLMAQDKDDIDSVLESVSLIRDAFEYRPNDSTVRDTQKAYRKSVLAFSDSVIVNVPLASRMTEIQGTFDGLMSELHSMAVAQAKCVENGLFLRGGVDLDWWYRHGETLVSKSLTVAYGLEGSACVPVIAVSERVFKYFSEHHGRSYYAKSADPFPSLVRRFIGDVCGTPVDVHFLDYLSAFAGEIDWTPSKSNRNHLLSLPAEERDAQMEAWRRENLTYWFAGHARMIELANSRTNVSSVQAKYKWLADYHNEVAPNWTDGEDSCVCVV